MWTGYYAKKKKKNTHELTTTPGNYFIDRASCTGGLVRGAFDHTPVSKWEGRVSQEESDAVVREAQGHSMGKLWRWNHS